MINFNDLRISPGGKEMFIDAEIASYSYYDGMYISQIVIDTEETFNISGPSGEPFYTKSFTEQNKEQSLYLTADNFSMASFTGHIYYVYVMVAGLPDSQTPCGWDNSYTMGVVLDWQPIYKIGIDSMRQVVDNCCSLDRDFIDYILRFESFELALRTGQYVLANDKFIQWFQDAESPIVKPPCNCG